MVIYVIMFGLFTTEHMTTLHYNIYVADDNDIVVEENQNGI